MKRLNDVLKEKNHTKKWLAEQVGLTPQTLNNYRRGSKTPKPGIVKHIAEILEVDVTELS